jgi:uncharacterized Ntn-hydrolase superfamily protein
MTFSLAALDPATGRLGYAVATSSVCVGARVGMIAHDCAVFSQARTDPRLHGIGAAAHAAGAGAAGAVAAMHAAATAPHWRQLGVLSRSGEAAHATGSSCLPHCGGLAGARCLALGNYLGSDQVLAAMIAAFERADGPLPARLLAGMAAGEAAGGEIDPLRSAALFVEGADAIADADLRADLHADPLAALAEMWENWVPKAAPYRVRALDPDAAAPSSEVEGHGRR